MILRFIMSVSVLCAGGSITNIDAGGFAMATSFFPIFCWKDKTVAFGSLESPSILGLAPRTPQRSIQNSDRGPDIIDFLRAVRNTQRRTAGRGRPPRASLPANGILDNLANEKRRRETVFTISSEPHLDLRWRGRLNHLQLRFGSRLFGGSVHEPPG